MQNSTIDAPRRAKLVTVPALRAMKKKQQRICMVTAYDATFARLFDDAGVDVLLVGDSLGMVIQGHDNTLPVTVDEMIYHTRAVSRGAKRAHVVADMPFGSYQEGPDQAFRTAVRLMKEGAAHSVKLEGGVDVAESIRKIVAGGIPVMAHVGLTPQSVHAMGGFRVQGKNAEAAHRVLEDALKVEEAGAFAVVLEGIPTDLAREITRQLSIPTIGIGAGVDCDGQVLVCYDLLGLTPDFRPKFVKRYAELYADGVTAAEEFCAEVKSGVFPDEAHSFGDVKKAPLSEPGELTLLSPTASASAPAEGPTSRTQPLEREAGARSLGPFAAGPVIAGSGPTL